MRCDFGLSNTRLGKKPLMPDPIRADAKGTHSGDPTTIDEDGMVYCAACGARASYLEGSPWFSAEDGSEVPECPGWPELTPEQQAVFDKIARF